MKDCLRRSISQLCLISLISSMIVAKAWPQSSVKTTIVGTITDTAGAVIEGAKVTATSEATGSAVSVSTNEAGRYTLLDLAAGKYDLAVEKTGFQRCVSKEVALDPAQTVTFSCSLKPGSIEQTVEVSGASLQVETESAQLATTLLDTTVQEVPVNGRNWSNLLGLMAGVFGGSEFNNFNAGFN